MSVWSRKGCRRTPWARAVQVLEGGFRSGLRPGAGEAAIASTVVALMGNGSREEREAATSVLKLFCGRMAVCGEQRAAADAGGDRTNGGDGATACERKNACSVRDREGVEVAADGRVATDGSKGSTGIVEDEDCRR